MPLVHIHLFLHINFLHIRAHACHFRFPTKSPTPWTTPSHEFPTQQNHDLGPLWHLNWQIIKLTNKSRVYLWWTMYWHVSIRGTSQGYLTTWSQPWNWPPFWTINFEYATLSPNKQNIFSLSVVQTCFFSVSWQLILIWRVDDGSWIPFTPLI